MRRKLSTTEVADALGIDQANLQRMIRHKRIPFPKLVHVGRLAIRLWSLRDVARVRKKLLAKKRRTKKGERRK
jgi:excisionase family DNA binding protein